MIRPHYLLLTLLCILYLSHQTNAQQIARMTTGGTGYLEHLPSDYSANTSREYPVIFFLHGLGETGTGTPADLNKVKAHGPPKLIEQGHNMCFNVNGVEECFIVISPQLRPGVGGWWPGILNEVFEYVINGSQNYRIDRNRIYLTGLSLGGQGVYIGLGETQDVFAGAAVIAGFNNGNGCVISSREIPVWGFHGQSDGTIPYPTGLTEFNRIGWCTSPSPTAELKWTTYAGVGHNAWDNAYSVDHTIQNPNLYEWLLSKSKNVGNSLPIVNAGNDTTIVLPTNEIFLIGSGTDPDGSVISYQWSKVSGPTITINAPNNPTLQLTNLKAGSYVFRLTVTDNLTATSFDEVTLIVSPASIPPIANAGPDQVIPVGNTASGAGLNKSVQTSSSIILYGSGIDMDGEILSYDWIQLSGPPSVLSNETTPNLSVDGLTGGVYNFRLMVFDNDGLMGLDDVTVTVNTFSSQNLALNKPVTVSSIESPTLTGAFAVDGNRNTRWSSNFSDPQWIYVDLENVFNIQNISIVWEHAYASGYTLQLSHDAKNWINVKEIISNTTLSNNYDSINQQGRYVRVYGSQRGTNYGYSIFELEVYGDSIVSEPLNLPPSANAGNDININLPVDTLTLSGTGFDPDGTISNYTWSQMEGPAITLQQNVNNLLLSNVGEGTYSFRFTVTDNKGLIAFDDITLNVNDGVEINLALNKSAFASSIEYFGLNPSFAVDGNSNTRWSSSFSDNNWIYVDLGASYQVSRIKILWEKAMATDYEIQVSQDISTWTSIRVISDNETLITNHQDINTTARYVRILGNRRRTVYGYSIYEFEVYGLPNKIPSSARIKSDFGEPKNNSVSFFPVPFKDRLSIKGITNCDYLIRNSYGVTIMEGTYSGEPIDMSLLSNGIYYIDLKHDNQIFRRKIVK